MKYHTSFSSVIKPLVPEYKDKFLALASLENLGEFLPNIDTEKNVDVLPIAFNACVVNRANKNGDVIDANTAIDIYKTFVNKPINIEHNREKLIGVILTAGFSEFGSDQPLPEEEVVDKKEPFNITLGGLVWKVVNTELASKIEESSDPESDLYMKISASWELGFSDYEVAIVKDGNDIAEAEIVSSEKDVDALKSHLKGFGGSGQLEDGRSVYRKVINDVVALGVGLTVSPAAEVKGLMTKLTLSEEESSEEESSAEILEEADQSAPSEIKQLENEKKCSQVQEKTVATDKGIIVMTKIKSLKDLTDDNLQELSASQVSDFIEDELKKSSEKFAEGKREVETQLQAAKEKHSALEGQHTELKQQVESLNSELEKLQAEAAKQLAEENFARRMSVLDDTYDLCDKDREVIASEVNDMSDEEFESYAKKLEVLLRDKNKEAIAAQSQKEAEEASKEEASREEKVLATASEPQPEEEREVVEEAISQAKTDSQDIPASVEASEQTVYDKYKQAFNVDEFDIQV